VEMDSKTEAVIAKVRKLLAMAEGNANENEAAVAAAKAQELLEAYNLDITIVNRRTGKHAARDDKTRAGGLYKWQRELWNAIATMNFCKYYFYRGLSAGSQYEHQLIGSKANVISTEVMGQYLEHTIERLARQWVNANRPGKSIFIKEAIAYREGVAANLSNRLWTLRYEHLKEQEAARKAERERNKAAGINTENALVLQDVINSEEDLNTDYINKWEPGTAAKQRVQREARQAAAEAEAARLLREQAEWDAAHPEEARARKEREAAKSAREYEEWSKRQSKQRGRKETAEEKRRRMPSFRTGYQDGDNVQLNKQIDKNSPKRLG
jgi:Protein of unknown function (DUF2786)